MKAEADFVLDKVAVAALENGAAKESTRYAISNLFVGPHGEAIATDGRLLVVGPRRRETEAEPVLLDPDTVRLAKGHLDRHQMPGSSVKGVAKRKKEGQRSIDLTLTGGGRTVEIADKEAEGNYPSIFEVVPKDDPLVSIAVNPLRLKRVMEFLAACMEEPDERGVIMELRGIEKPIFFRVQESDAKAVLMPMKGLGLAEAEKRWRKVEAALKPEKETT